MATAIGELKKTGERCYCGEPLPWHLHELGNARFSHTCSNGHNWAWARDGFSYNGIRLLFAARAGVQFQIVNAGPSMPLGVTENTMTGIITVTPATDGGGVITSTADDVRDALRSMIARRKRSATSTTAAGPDRSAVD